MSKKITLTNSSQITEECNKYHERGAVILKRFLNEESMSALIEASNNNVKQSDRSKEFTPGFDRFSNKFIERSSKIERIVTKLIHPINTIVREKVICTQALLLGMNQGTEGFPWHFDEYSYCFIRPEDTALSLWVPLIPINTKKQHGGMNWVNQNDFSARSRMQQWAFHQKNGLQVEAKSRMQSWEHYKKKGDDAEIPCNIFDEMKWEQYGDRWTGKYDLKMLDSLKQEEDMELGDALLFNRYTWHKTHPMRFGDIPSRTAIVFRMVSADAKFDKTLFEKTMELRNKIKAPDSFGHLLANLEDGTTIGEAEEQGISIFSKK